MEYIPNSFMIIVYAGILGLFIYFVVKRLKDKDKEDFEKREN